MRSASLDYFRLPSVQAWRDRIEKIRGAGFNCVAISYPWSYHAETPGTYDWSGIRDVDALHDLIEDAGLYLIARPGPYVGADLDCGGLPAWLIRDPRVDLRCRSVGEFSYSLAFMQRVEEWFDQLVPRFAGRANLLLVEVEHHYSVPPPLPWARTDTAALLGRVLGADAVLGLLIWLQNGPFLAPARPPRAGEAPHAPYLRELCAMLRERGVEAPTIHADLGPAVPQVAVDLPAIERRVAGPRAPERLFREELLAIREDADALPAGVPLIHLGLDAGISDRWGGRGERWLRESAEARPIEGLVLAALAEGAAVVNVRRFCGGVTWGYLGSPGVYSSYDCGSPVSESGALTESYRALLRLNAWIDGVEADLCASQLAERRSEDGLLLWSRRSADHLLRFVLNSAPSEAELDRPGEPETRLAPLEGQLRIYDRDGTFQRVHSPLRGSEPGEAGRRGPGRDLLPDLGPWTFSCTSPQLEPAFDDGGWAEISREQLQRGDIDMDALGIHHGFIWYRGTFAGDLDRLGLAARHCHAVWLNGERIASGDPSRNPQGLLADAPARLALRPRPGLCTPGRNALVVLVESLGHLEGLVGAADASPGLLELDTGTTRVRWRYRGGLVRGERGVAPVVAFEAVDRSAATQVDLPHGWAGAPEGVALFETRFRLQALDAKSGPLALRLDPGRGKANLYVNGYLIGRFWPERGPQREFPLPWGVLSATEENHLAIAVWKRTPTAALGRARLVFA